MSNVMKWLLKILPFLEPAIHAIAATAETASLPGATKSQIAVAAATAAGTVAAAGLEADGEQMDAETATAVSGILANTVDATVADLKKQGTLGQVAAVTDTAVQAVSEAAATIAAAQAGNEAATT